MALSGSLQLVNHMKFAPWIIFPLRQGLSLQTVWPEMYYIIQAILKVAANARMTGTMAGCPMRSVAIFPGDTVGFLDLACWPKSCADTKGRTNVTVSKPTFSKAPSGLKCY